MKKFRVFVRGENFLINFNDVETKFGFYTTRLVEAQNEAAAEYSVMDMLRVELTNRVLNERSDTPMMYGEDVEEIDSFAGFPVPGGGFTFYRDKKEV